MRRFRCARLPKRSAFSGALYNYIPDKQSLLHSLMQGHMRELLAAWQAQEKPQDALALLEQFVRFHIGFHMQRSDEVFIAYMELRNLSDENFATIEALRRAYEDALEAVLKQGVEAGQFTLPDTKIATLAVIAMLNGVMTWYRSGGRLSLDEVESVYWDMVRKSVTA